MEQIKAYWEKIDPKLKYTLLSAAVTYALTRAAITLDPTLSVIISGAIASFVGYNVENGASELAAMPASWVPEDSGGLAEVLADQASEEGMVKALGEADIVPDIDEEIDLPVAA